VQERKALIERDHDIALSRQAELLDIARGTIYTTPVPMSADDLKILTALDKEYTDHPEYGVLKLVFVLKRDHGIEIGKDRLRTLRRILGLETIYAKPRTSVPNLAHRIYPDLLRDYRITRPNEVWGTDITYIRIVGGFCYLVALIDWFSRAVVAWRVSPTMESSFCIETLDEALQEATPHIHNSDQGVQFTDGDYTSILKTHDVQISMDGRGRCMDNIFTERLWRSVKYEHIYTHGHSSIEEVREGLSRYFVHYNTSRPHQSLAYKTPHEVHYQTV
jgi:putative transposase